MHTKRLPDILTIFPVKYINDSINNGDDGNDDVADNELISIEKHLDNDEMCNAIDMDCVIDVDGKKFKLKMSDHAIFTHYLKIAIDLDRSERLSEMIKTTGFQLYNTFINSSGPYSDVAKTNVEN